VTFSATAHVGKESFRIDSILRFGARTADDDVRADWAVVSARGVKSAMKKAASLPVWSLGDKDDDGGVTLFECCGEGCTKVAVVSHNALMVPMTIGANIGSSHTIVGADTRLQGGHSGAPVLNQRGECVGLYLGQTGVWLFGRTGSNHVRDLELCKAYGVEDSE